MVEWFQGDLASWLTVAITLVVAALAWRALRPSSYIEFHDNWNIKIKDKKIVATGHITMDTSSSRTTGNGLLELNNIKIPLYFQSMEQHMIYKANVCVFEGEYEKEIPEGYLGKLKLTIKLGDGTKKKYKKQIQVIRETNS